MLDIQVFTLALYPDLKPIHCLLESAEYFGINVYPYTIPDYRYDGWFNIKIVHMLEALRSIESKHVLYTDGSDAIFTDSMQSIEMWYSYLDSPPMLTAASINPFNDTYIGTEESREAEQYYPILDTPYKFPHAGGFMGERLFIIEVLERMKQEYSEYADDAQVWHEAWKDGWFRPVLDNHCHVFQVGCRGTALEHLTIHGGMLQNNTTHTTPCIFHHNGGYTSQETGKDDRLLPYLRQICQE